MPCRLGDRVRIDIPDDLDPDFEFHGKHAIVTDIDHTGCSCSCAVLYRVVLEDRDLAIDIIPGTFGHRHSRRRSWIDHSPPTDR